MTGAEFRAMLKDLGLSQRALAERLGLAISTVNRWALDKAPVPQYAVAYLELARNEKGRPKAP
jgi:transcriptional regulator with XRE-family HTH domain